MNDGPAILLLMSMDVSGDDRIDVVGESFCREALRRVTGVANGLEPARQHIATLVPEPTNAYDRNAIKVLIAGEHVGYIPRELASVLAEAVAALHIEHAEVTALAEISGNDTDLGFGVTVYLKLQMLNVVVIRDDDEDLDDRLLIDSPVPSSSRPVRPETTKARTTPEAAQALGVTEATLTARRGTVARAVERWKSDLIDLTARNRLLYLRDLQTGTLSLDAVARGELMQLVAGKRVALSKLVPRSLSPASPASKVTPFEDAVRRTRAITRTARAYEEERGVRTLFLACGLATWASKRASRPPAAPVLLVPIEIRARGASQQDFELSTLGDLEVNPTLLHLLRVEFNLDVDPQDLFQHADMDGAIDTPEELQLAFDWLSTCCAAIAGWEIAERFVLGNFWYAKLPMVRDLETSIDTLSSHDVAAALAGHAEAKDRVLARRTRSARPDVTVDQFDPGEEFNVLDSDSSQSLSIARALKGEDLVLKGPPGTGKSQTIANLICNAIGNRKRVLFVAEKRAAIDAVTKRLNAAGLESLVLDLHRGAESRKWLAAQLGISLEEARTTGAAIYEDQHAQLSRVRATLERHPEALHRPVPPWNVSIYDAQLQVLERGYPRVTTRLRLDELQDLTPPRLEELIERLHDLLAVGGLSFRLEGSPWADADVRTAEQGRRAWDLLQEVADPNLGTLERDLTRAAGTTGCPRPSNFREAEALIDLWRRAAVCSETFHQELFAADLQELSATLRPLAGGGLARFAASIGSAKLRAARRAARSQLRGNTELAPGDLAEAVNEAAALQQAWQAATTPAGLPMAPDELEPLTRSTSALREALTRLGQIVGQDLVARSFATLHADTEGLAADRATLAVLPDALRARAALTDAKLGGLLVELEDRPELLPDAANELRRMWWLSLAEELTAMTSTDGASLSAFRGDRHEQTRRTFRELDHAHVASSAQRVRRAAAEAAIDAQDRHPEQAQLVRGQAKRKRGHLPVRELFRQAPDVVTALRPCWVMSPLMVSQLIPSERAHFDMVVFDEASQVRPVDALSSMIRGHQLIVAGDERQLPPTTFFDAAAQGTEEEHEGDPEDASEIGDYESVLDVLMTLFETEMLRWHYRSRDERLIGFSNREIYGSSLTTFPGAIGEDVLRHVLVDEPSLEGESRVSPDAEVRRAVALVLEHATQRPHETLGVIALGSRHADAIEAGVLSALADRPELEGFFADDREERFFVKNLERVQGDERDAIILAIGYGKNPDGTLPHRFGPLNNEGGERRLNVAVSRAKRRMTVVSSFSADDIDPSRSRATGVRLLKAFFEYAGTGGAPIGGEDSGQATVLHRQIEAALIAAGHGVIVAPGASEDRLDLAVLDQETGMPAIAIDLDGPSYARRRSVRDRDRLRPEQLARLGWQYVSAWSQDWYRAPDAASARLLIDVDEGLAAARDARSKVASASSVGVEFTQVHAAASSPDRPERRHFEPRLRAAKPYFASGGPAITDWHHEDLVALAAWIETDGLLRTSEELQREMMSELGFSRRGSRVAAALDAAVGALRSQDLA